MPVLEKSFGKEKLVVRYKVDIEHSGMRLDQYIKLYLTSFSRQKIKKKIDLGEIIIKGHPGNHRPSTKIRHNDIITMTINKTTHEDEYWKGKKIELATSPDILYEDDKVIIISKPPFMSAHPTGRHIFNCASVYFEALLERPVHCIHRIDRETSGMLLIAKNPTTAAHLTYQFENHQVNKCYFFISKIDPKKFNGLVRFHVNHRLGPAEKKVKHVMINAFPSDSTLGKKAQTFFKIFYHDQKYAIGLAFPTTGRQHQIRVHAAIYGLPLVGDKLYLGNYKLFQRFKDLKATEFDHDFMEIPRHALHSMALCFNYNKKMRTFIAPLPSDLKSFILSKTKINLKELEKNLEKEISDYFTFNKDSANS